MPISETAVKRRTKHIGSSDMAAVLGVDPWQSAYDVWLDKTGQLKDRDTPAMAAGRQFELGVLDRAAEALGKLRRNQYRVAPAYHLAANIDAIVEQTGEPVEAKTAGLFGPLPDNWGDPQTDHVPNAYIVQCHVHMICLANGDQHPEQCHLMAFLGGRGFVIYAIPWSAELAAIIKDRAVDFWESHVTTRQPPPDVAPSLDVVRLVRRVPDKIVDVDPLLYVEWQRAQEIAKQAQATADRNKALLLAAMNDAEAARIGNGQMVTYMAEKCRRVDTARLRGELPDVAKRFEVVSTRHILRTRKDTS